MAIGGINAGASGHAARYSGYRSQIFNQMGIHAERVETGNKINRPSDDPAGLQQAVNLNGDIAQVASAIDRNNSMSGEIKRAEEAITAAIGQVEEMIKIAQGILGEGDAGARTAAKSQADAYGDAANSILSSFQIGTNAWLDGGAAITHNNGVADVTLTGADLDTTTLGIATGDFTLDTDANTGTAITALEAALTTLNQNAARIGSTRDASIDKVNQYMANTMSIYQSQYDSVMETDVAAESAVLTKLQILDAQGASVAGIQNASRANVLALLGG